MATPAEICEAREDAGTFPTSCFLFAECFESTYYSGSLVTSPCDFSTKCFDHVVSPGTCYDSHTFRVTCGSSTSFVRCFARRCTSDRVPLRVSSDGVSQALDARSGSTDQCSPQASFPPKPFYSTLTAEATSGFWPSHCQQRREMWYVLNGWLVRCPGWSGRWCAWVYRLVRAVRTSTRLIRHLRFATTLSGGASASLPPLPFFFCALSRGFH